MHLSATDSIVITNLIYSTDISAYCIRSPRPSNPSSETASHSLPSLYPNGERDKSHEMGIKQQKEGQESTCLGLDRIDDRTG